jgi:uncharacterized membrane protein YvlD (DUF360 family)/uncharacterized BrkB/YihY/UPF0761 family membrane protein
MKAPTVVLPSDDIAALSARLWGSFLGRCVRRFLVMGGIDRCLVISSQAFTALIPLVLLMSALAPAGQEDAITQAIVTRFGLEGDSAAAVEQLFTTPTGAASGLSLFSALLLLFSGVSFTRRVQAMYQAAWGQQKEAVRSGLFAALGLLAMLIEIVALYSIRALFRGLPLDWLWMLPVSAITGFVLWTSIPYLLLNRQVHWRRLLVSGAVAALATAVFGVATIVYMPPVVAKYTNQFGLFGITIALIGWLLSSAAVITASAAVGAEFDASHERWVLRLKNRYGLVDPSVGPQAVPDPTEGTGLTSGDLLMIARIAVNWMIMSVAVWAATAVVPGIDVEGGVLTYLWVSLLFGLVNSALAPLLQLVAVPSTVLTLGVFALVVNGCLLVITAVLTANLGIEGFRSAVLGALVISVVITVIELVLRPVRRRTSPVREEAHP